MVWLAFPLIVHRAFAVSGLGGARAADEALQGGAGTLSSFLADLSTQRPWLYALLSFLTVTVAAFVLSILSECLMDLLGDNHKSLSKTQNRRD
ncbi:MAG: hypothetical protein K9N51_10815 [Candidatus Pacebacteria bacterium]|nr:hypothetical protein [Candidatus Paceibacterota bacterium]